MERLQEDGIGLQDGLAQAQARLRRKAQASMRIHQAYFAGHLGYQQYRMYLARALEAEKAARSEVERLTSAEGWTRDEESIRERAQALARSVRDLPFEAKQGILRAMVRQVIVLPEQKVRALCLF